MKILYVTTISLTMNSFFKPHIQMLVCEGNQVEIACNDRDLPLDPIYNSLGCKTYRVDFSRSPLSKNNLLAYKQLKKVIENGNYDIVHCHTPNASVITRLVCRKFRNTNGLKVFYTAHGFHFYNGAPIINWILFYPIEKYCSLFTDKLITINQEDYALATKKFRAKEIYYVPGVGVDTEKFRNIHIDRRAKRNEIGVPEDAFLLLSVGELNKNKNHQIVIRALAQLHAPNVHYAIAGVGDQKERLLNLAKELGVSNQVHLLGYRTDVAELYKTADVFCFPSYREGLPMAPIEAMSCGVPVVAADNRGTRSVITDGKNGYLCRADSARAFDHMVGILIRDARVYDAFAKQGSATAENYCIDSVLSLLRKVYDLDFGRNSMGET